MHCRLTQSIDSSFKIEVMFLLSMVYKLLHRRQQLRTEEAHYRLRILAVRVLEFQLNTRLASAVRIRLFHDELLVLNISVVGHFAIAIVAVVAGWDLVVSTRLADFGKTATHDCSGPIRYK